MDWSNCLVDTPESGRKISMRMEQTKTEYYNWLFLGNRKTPDPVKFILLSNKIHNNELLRVLFYTFY